MRSAVSLCGGSTNLRWSASISFEPNVGGKNKSNRGTTLKTSWCLLLRGVSRQISNSFRGEILGKGVLL